LTRSLEIRLPDFVRTKVWPARDAFTGVAIEVDEDGAGGAALDDDVDAEGCVFAVAV
jgi:hypothetical protein